MSSLIHYRFVLWKVAVLEMDFVRNGLSSLDQFPTFLYAWRWIFIRHIRRPNWYICFRKYCILYCGHCSKCKNMVQHKHSYLVLRDPHPVVNSILCSNLCHWIVDSLFSRLIFNVWIYVSYSFSLFLVYIFYWPDLFAWTFDWINIWEVRWIQGRKENEILKKIDG